VTFSGFVAKRLQMSFSLERKLSNATQILALKIEENFEEREKEIDQPKMTSSPCIFQLRHVLGVILFLSFILTTLITKQQVITVIWSISPTFYA